MRWFYVPVLLAVVVASSAVPLSGSLQDGGVSDAAVESGAATQTDALQNRAASTTQQVSGLPSQPTPPRTLRAHWHVYIAFALTWLLLFGYAVSLGRRFGRLEDEIKQASGA